MKSFQDVRYLVGNYLAQRVLTGELGIDRIYDVGPLPVWLQLENAHSRICDYVATQVDFRLADLAQRGAVSERASHVELGLQAADIAAALASREYELAADGEWRDRAPAVKRMFGRVCLNGHWVEPAREPPLDLCFFTPST